MDANNLSSILDELRLVLPSGFQCEQIYCLPPDKWKRVTDSSTVKELVKYNPAWSGVELIRIGGTQYGDEVVVTSPDPISPKGAIYAIGEMAGPEDAELWPECMIRLGLTAKEWIDRVMDFGDDFCVCPGSLDDDLGDRADEYRAQIRALNPGIDW